MVQILNRGSIRPASPRLQRRNEQRRLEILQAAAKVFRRRGYAASGMREIADELDSSAGNLYYYFRGKDEILYFCQDRALDLMQAAVGEALRSAAPYAKKLESVIRAHVRIMLGELEGATAHLEVDALPEELRRAVVGKRDAYEHSIRKLVAAGVKASEFEPCDAALVTRAILGAVNWTARWYRPDGAQPVAQIAAALSDYLVRGLLAAPQAGAAP